SQGLAGTAREAHRNLQDEEPRRMVQDHGRHRYLLCACPNHGGSAKASAQCRAQDLRRASRRHATGARTALLPHAIGDPRCGNRGYWRADERVEEIVGWAKARLSRRAHHQQLQCPTMVGTLALCPPYSAACSTFSTPL